ncbi:MAG: hypothetical protein ABT940_13935, partial [Alphaproteobacteria bacterium]
PAATGDQLADHGLPGRAKRVADVPLDDIVDTEGGASARAPSFFVVFAVSGFSQRVICCHIAFVKADKTPYHMS